MITFDDGYLDNYTLAYPALKELGIPAIFFIPTDMISKRRLGWWDVSAFILKNSQNNDIHFCGNRLILYGNRQNAIRHVNSVMQYMPPCEIHQTLASLSEECKVSIPAASVQGRELMDWDQIRTLSREGMGIGSHTHTHPVLSTIPPDEQRREMLISRQFIEKETGCRPTSIAYPLGGYSHITEDSLKIVGESGYSAGFSFNTGVNFFSKLKPYDIKRIAADSDFYVFSTAILTSMSSKKSVSKLKGKH
jgi:peptidoglycan/xylan/chitin deacetylase (PgdA/CDA1 family)